MVCDDDAVGLLDFGLAKLQSGEALVNRIVMEEPVPVATFRDFDAELVAAGRIPVDSTLLDDILRRAYAIDLEERLCSKFEPLHDICTPTVIAPERAATVATLLARQGRLDEAWRIQRRIASHPPIRAWQWLVAAAAGALAGELRSLAGDHARPSRARRRASLTPLRRGLTFAPHTAGCSRRRFGGAPPLASR